ncbi:hypothetical protein GCM10009127_07590 [Alteraurantiacibacter aestuarii]|uniref:HAD family hydrolase n=1 Tax=Alteraurantiacibacter aestuarii TaxID=650004 RepID=A0A844ZIQ5_9SPHN|nr:5'-nucleotidase [Alteraurantiacibacter aestuarii]MXO87152.1 HAD family hydrolase [Alteraurantiacibacter aestuarii]
MSRPLVITDCDEVLLHMVRHFRDWLGEQHGVDFELAGNNFLHAMKRRDSDRPMTEDEVWELLGLFFDTEMGRQTQIAGSVQAIAELQREADVVVLTNLVDKRNAARTQQLRDFGIEARVFTNQGPKGEALGRIVREYGPSRSVFIDDIANHHQSAADVVPQVHRLHFCGEPAIAPHVPCALEAGHAHARIDSWDQALPWILGTLHGEA